jgi:hypothetical protein
MPPTPPKIRPTRKRPDKSRHPGRHKGLVLLHRLVTAANNAADLAEEFLHEHGEDCRCPTCRWIVQSGVFASHDGQTDLFFLRRDLMTLSHVTGTYADFVQGHLPALPPEESHAR